MLTSLTYHYTREYLYRTNESCSFHISDSLPAEADFIVVSVLRKEVEVNIVSALGQQSLQILTRDKVR